jgi:hypothetical protein
MLFEAADPSHAGAGSVTFDAGARTAWHSHPRGQVLIVTAGVGRVQQWGDAVQEIRTATSSESLPAVSTGMGVATCIHDPRCYQ